MLRTIMTMHGKLKGVPGLSAESVLKAELENGSRIVALPGNERTVRGYAPPIYLSSTKQVASTTRYSAQSDQ